MVEAACVLALEYLYTVLVLVENDKRATWKDDVNVRMKSRTCAVRAAETTDVPGVDKFSLECVFSLLRKKPCIFLSPSAPARAACPALLRSLVKVSPVLSPWLHFN